MSGVKIGDRLIEHEATDRAIGAQADLHEHASKMHTLKFATGQSLDRLFGEVPAFGPFHRLKSHGQAASPVTMRRSAEQDDLQGGKFERHDPMLRQHRAAPGKLSRRPLLKRLVTKNHGAR